MIGRRGFCGIGVGLGLLGCTPQGSLRVDPAPVSATPGRRTSADPDTNRIVTEIGNDVLQLTVYPDRVYVTTVDRRNVVSNGNPFAPTPAAPVPDMIGLPDRAVPFPADAFLVGTVRRLVGANGADFGTVGQPEGQIILDMRKGSFPTEQTVRCAVAPDREVPVHDYRTEQGVADGLTELRAVPRSATHAIRLTRGSREDPLLALDGRADELDQTWFRGQYRPLQRSKILNPPGLEPMDPAVVDARALLLVADEVERRTPDQLYRGVTARNRNGRPVIEFYAGGEEGPRLSGTADLDGRILEIR